MPFRRTYPSGSHLQPITNAHVSQNVLWLVLHNGGFVVQQSQDAWSLPGHDSALAVMLLERDTLRLGHIDERECLLVEIDASAPLPDDHQVVGLRELYGRIDEEHYALAGYATQMALWPVNPCTITLVHDGERVLLTHKKGWGPRFGLVAGFVEPGESFEDSLRREVAEEVGVTVSNTEYFRSQPWPFPHQIMVGYFARYESGEVAIDADELDDARWFHIDALPVIPPPFSIARQLIDTWAARIGRDTRSL
ncbi:MAG: NAD(+) diphosphatase [Chloroflexi bacterium]|nr:NAD(+) diphosphatase [Chloroflexota bacterium]